MADDRPVPRHGTREGRSGRWGGLTPPAPPPRPGDPVRPPGPVRRTGLVHLAGLVIAVTVVTGVTGAAGAVPPVPGEALSRDLILSTVHDGPFEAGGTGVFSVDVVAGRHSPGITRPTGVTYHFPGGLTPLRARGAGWTCRITVRRLGCGTAGQAAPGFQLPRITVEVAVAPEAAGTLTVSGRAVQTMPPPGTGNAAATGTTAEAGAAAGAGTGTGATAGTATGTGPAMDTVAASVRVLPAPAP